MRIGRWHVPLTAADTPELRPDDEKPKPQLGSSGTVNYKGFLEVSEYNRDLVGDRAVDVWERMRRSDPAVRETLWHMYAPILNARWTVEPPPDATDEELEVTEFVRCAYFEWLGQPFMEYLQNTLTYLAFGHMVFETTLQTVTRPLFVKKYGVPAEESEESGESKPPETATAASPPVEAGPPNITPIPPAPVAETNEVPPREFITWRRFAPRLPKTIWKWNVDENDDLISITQWAYKQKPNGEQTWEHVEIPAEYLLVFTHEKWGDEWTGISILRAAYKPWVLKELLEKIMGIAFERHGAGILVGYIPRDREDDQALMDKLEQDMQNLRAGEFSYMLFPGPKAQGNTLGYQLEIMSPPGGIPDFKASLEYLRGEIKGAVLARFSELGHAQTGARATANVQAEVWYNALHAVARYIEDVNAEAIRRLVDMNYEGQTRYPRLHASGIEARNLLEFAQSLALLTNAKLMNPDGPVRAWVRDAIDAPEENEDEAQILQEQARQQFELDKAVQQVEMQPEETARPRASKSSTSTSTKADDYTGEDMQIHLHLPESLVASAELSVPAPEVVVNVPPANVEVTVEPAAAPSVEVSVEPTPVEVTVASPEITVQPAAVDVKLELPEREISFERTGEGKVRAAKVRDKKKE